MKTILCLFSSLLPFLLLSQTKPYFQQKADIQIKASLNTVEKTLDGFISIHYTNNSPDSLSFIWMHLWPNAYKNDQTAFSEQLLQNGRTDFYFSDDSKRGYINRLNFEVDNVSATLEDHPLYIDVAKLLLPNKLAPGQTAIITTPFHEKLPYLWSGDGYSEDNFSITQWFPKPAVYDQHGWHPMPYLNQGQLYSEFGNYQVELTIPGRFVVAATGVLKEKTSTNHNSITYKYEAENVHDFAWFASPNFKVDSSSVTSIDGHSIKLFTYFPKDAPPTYKKGMDYLKSAIQDREKKIGPYPYQAATVVALKEPFTGSLEVPTIAAIGIVEDPHTLEGLINQEAGHFWFYGVVANNERAYPWMDQGFNTYYTNRYLEEKYGISDPAVKTNFALENLFAEKKDQPILTSSAEFSASNYYAVSYEKAAQWMKLLQTTVGVEKFDQLMKEYYQQWQFRHPYPADFERLFNQNAAGTDTVFSLLDKNGSLFPHRNKKLKTAFLLKYKNNTPANNYIFLSPALGFNSYDKLMIGGLIHNYTLPETAFQFVIAPLYATGSNSLNGIGRISYTLASYGKIRKVEFSLSGEKFNMDEFTDSTGKKNFMDFNKIVPSVKLTFKNNNPRSQAAFSLQWKTYFFKETSILFSRDTVNNQDIITYPKANRYLNQLSLQYKNTRALYPYDVLVTAQQANEFIKVTADLNYFFNYVKGGGLDVRLFAGKFFYTGQKTIYTRFATSRYHLNMTGPNGNEDYTYSNYFAGRNEFQGFASQQIMIADGGFKIRTDLLANKIGRSDNWLAAVNFKTDIPKKINPLQVVPLPLDLKMFLDVGTYSGSWSKDNITGRFLYEAGLQLSVYHQLVNFYLPLIYSSVYRDYIKSTIPQNKRFTNLISFSIDFQKISWKKLAGKKDN